MEIIKSKEFIQSSTIEWQQMAEGVKRKIMAYDDNLMLVRVEFETGGIGTLHQHYHTQITNIESGVFEIIAKSHSRIFQQFS